MLISILGQMGRHVPQCRDYPPATAAVIHDAEKGILILKEPRLFFNYCDKNDPKNFYVHAGTKINTPNYSLELVSKPSRKWRRGPSAMGG